MTFYHSLLTERDGYCDYFVLSRHSCNIRLFLHYQNWDRICDWALCRRAELAPPASLSPSLSLSPFSDELTGTVVTLRRPNPLDYPPHQPRMRRNKPAPLPSRFFRRGGERGERKSSETNDITTAQSENTGRLRSWCFVNLFGMWQGRSRCNVG